MARLRSERSPTKRKRREEGSIYIFLLAAGPTHAAPRQSVDGREPRAAGKHESLVEARRELGGRRSLGENVYRNRFVVEQFLR